MDIQKPNEILIVGLTLPQLLDEYKAYLFDDFLPFMDQHIVDHEYGGFKCHTDRVGNNLSTNKRAWYDGRGIWVYSYLYNHFRPDPDYLKIAKNTIDLVMKCKPSGDGFWPWSYNQTGVDLGEGLDDIYGNLFIAEGLVEYSVATGDPAYWEQAKEIILTCAARYDRDDYSYLLEYSPVVSDIKAPRVLGHWMILMHLATSLLKVKEDAEIEALADRCVNALLNNHLNPQFNLMVEVLNHDLTLPEGPLSQFVYIGHAMETLWMVMDEALRKGDDDLFQRASSLFKRHVEVAYDDVYGGVFHGLNHVDQNDWLLDKVLWAQEEVLVGLLLLIEQTGDEWAHRWFNKMYPYVIDTFSLAKHGYSLWNIGGDRKVTFIKEGIRVENYHHPRHLMLNIQRLERMISKSK